MADDRQAGGITHSLQNRFLDDRPRFQEPFSFHRQTAMIEKRQNKSTAVSTAEPVDMFEDWYRTLFEHTGTAIAVLNGDMSVFSANDEFKRLVGRPILKRTASVRFLDFVVPDDRERLQRYHRQRRKEGGKAPAEYEFRLVGEKGERHFVAATVDVIPGTDKSILSLINITEKKEAELALRESERLMTTMLENFPGVVYHCRHPSHWRIAFVSPGCKELTGYDQSAFVGPLDELHRRLIHADDREKVRSEIRRSLREQQRFGLTYRIQTASGEEKWVWEQGAGHYDQGDLVSFEGFITDITHHKLAEIELAKEIETLKVSLKGRYKLGSIIGISPAMQTVYEQVIQAARTDASVVISGKSGTGKELVARAIHDLSDRKEKAFVPVNCGAIPDNLLESEFFGYKKGAFTGANSDAKGYLEVADGGSLFLDELEALSTIMQVKLLRVIDGYGYTPIGSSETRTTDIRIIAATNVALQDHLDQGLMREDFYFRINVFPIEVPPLRERPQDIPLLIDYFLQKFAAKDAPLAIPPAIREALKKYDWPGNVRELQNTIQRYAATGNFSFFDLSSSIADRSVDVSDTLSQSTDGSLQERMEGLEKKVILKALEQNRWQRGVTADMLKIDRKTLLRKMKRHGIR